MEIIGKRKIFLTISGALVLASWTSLLVFGLRPGMDFTGGSLWEIKITGVAQNEARTKVESAFKSAGIEKFSLQTSGENNFLIKFQDITEERHQELKVNIEQLEISSANVVGEELNIEGKQAKIEEIRFETIGPTIGTELRQKAYWAIALALIFIVLYIAFAFRKVSEPVSSWKYGVIAVSALIHDVSIPAGVFSVLGHTNGYEVDTLFVTALLTVLGFSVHDTIVVFDRIRENLLKFKNETYESVVNKSVNQTIARSINTSLTTLLVLLSLYFFGGESIRNFVLVLILGISIGTYSSIFVASPLAVMWNLRVQNKAKKK